MFSVNRFFSEEEEISYIISRGRRLPVPSGTVISTNEILKLPFPTDQKVVETNEGEIVVVIHAPDEGDSLELPSINISPMIGPTISGAQKLDFIFDRAARASTVGTWAASRLFKRAAVREILLGIAEVRYFGAKKRFETEALRIQTLEGSPLTPSQARATGRFQRGAKTEAFRLRRIKRARQAKVIKRQRLARVTRRQAIRRGTLMIGARTVRKALTPLTILAFTVDAILVSERALRGFEKEGVPGAFGGAAAGIVDVAVLGLAPESALAKIESEVSGATHSALLGLTSINPTGTLGKLVRGS